jgi:nicotinamidase-related amidase
LLESLTRDGRELSAAQRTSRLHVPPGSWDAKVLAEVAPKEDEMVLRWYDDGGATQLASVLRNLGCQHLLLVGGGTSRGLEPIVREALKHDLDVARRCPPLILAH